MKTKAFLALLALVIVIAPGVALADVTTAAGGLGFFNGDGSTPDGNFITTTLNLGGSDTITISLRAKYRGDGTLTVPTGNDYACTAGGGVAGHIGQCNFEYSVATTGSLFVDSFDYMISIQDLTVPAHSYGYDPLVTNNDNAYFDTSIHNGSHIAFGAMTANATIMQNSEWPAFFMPWTSTDQIAIYMTATRGTDSLSNEIGINTAVPEPAAAILTPCLIGFVGLGSLIVRRRRA